MSAFCKSGHSSSVSPASALRHKRSFDPYHLNVRFTPEAIIRLRPNENGGTMRRSGYTQMLSVTLGRSERTGAARWQRILFQLDGNDMYCGLAHVFQ